jgi:hypothetical protein
MPKQHALQCAARRVNDWLIVLSQLARAMHQCRLNVITQALSVRTVSVSNVSLTAAVFYSCAYEDTIAVLSHGRSACVHDHAHIEEAQ